jgi:ABC-type sugar transport system substrate-binding protein
MAAKSARMSSSIVGVLVGLLAAAFIVGCGESATDDGKMRIAMMPKLVGIDYFNACEVGAKRAADELGVTLIYNGPTEPSASEQNDFLQTWIRQGVDAICIAPNDPEAVEKWVAEAQKAGIKVLTWDTDAAKSGRDLMVNQVDDDKLGTMLIDELARQMGEEGEWANVLASRDAANLNGWRKVVEKRAAEKYPRMKLVETVLTEENETTARNKVGTLLNAYPSLKGLVAYDSNSVPGAAKAIQLADRVGEVKLVGNSTPGRMRPYIKAGVLECFFLWDPQELGYLTVHCAKLLVDGVKLESGRKIGSALKLTFSPKDPKMVILSDPIRFTADNIDEYDFGI